MAHDAALQLLKTYFGYDSFRPLQADIIDAVSTQQRDVLVLMPTGGGKSVCYQLPALLSDGLCVVVSPLIALMKDQVEGLQLNGIAAAYLNSTQTDTEQRHIERKALNGELKLLYVSPEKMQGESFRELLHRLPVRLFAIDEAHCISFWGHDFRPDYQQLSYLKRAFPQLPIIALTATADRLTRNDIVAQLQLNEPQMFVSSFDRPNIFLAVLPAQDRMNKIATFLEQHANESGIIYCLSRNSTEQLAAKLQQRGFKAAAYHAGLPHDTRSAVQNNFLKDHITIVCATVAFGMGIDKPNVRFVIHYNLPKNIESYYQEIGRAGRDSLPANALLFYTFADVALQRSMLDKEESNIQELKMTKLDRLQQFAESHTCRRRTLLAYFNENYPNDCQRCDVCRSPRQMVDATVAAQKILSAVARVQQAEPIYVIVDILRGYQSQRIRQQAYHQLKTFGTGRDLKPQEWNDYILQMINLGYLDIAYDRHNALGHTPQSRAVLFDGERVWLAQQQPSAPSTKDGRRQKVGAALHTEVAMTEQPDFDAALFEHLRVTRRQLADELDVAPYIIFGDNTLRQLCLYRPQNIEQLLRISGVGQRKADSYGTTFLQAISQYLSNEQQTAELPSVGKEASSTPKTSIATAPPTTAQYKNLLYGQLHNAYAQQLNPVELENICAKIPVTTSEVQQVLPKLPANTAEQVARTITQFLATDGVQMKGISSKISYALFQQGLNTSEIAQQRFLTEKTIIGHLADLYAHADYQIDMGRLISSSELADILPVIQHLGADNGLKPILEALDGKYDYGKIRLAMAVYLQQA